MQTIKEKKLLVKFAKSMGQPIDPALVEEVEKYEALQETIKESVRSMAKDVFDFPVKVTVAETVADPIVEPEPIAEVFEEPEVEESRTEQAEAPNLIDRAVKAIKPLVSEADSYQQPSVPAPNDLKAIREKIKFLEQWISKISLTGPGGGEVNLRWLDDVKRDTISDGRWLKYSEADKKFVFDEINPFEVVHNTTLVTTATYQVNDTDWYIGVNYAGNVTITLPVSPSSGRVLVIKDESGNASINPIAVTGTVDNDAGGFILQMDNGGIQMVYRAGWRII